MRDIRPKTTEVNRVLAKHYGFTKGELDFIVNYDIKRRISLSVEQMGLGGQAEEK